MITLLGLVEHCEPISSAYGTPRSRRCRAVGGACRFLPRKLLGLPLALSRTEDDLRIDIHRRTNAPWLFVWNPFRWESIASSPPISSPLGQNQTEEGLEIAYLISKYKMRISPKNSLSSLSTDVIHFQRVESFLVLCFA